MLRSLCCIWMLLFFSEAVFAQQIIEKNDTAYYVRYRHKLGITPMISKQQNGLNLSMDGQDRVRYLSNKPASFGLQLRYDFLSIGAQVGIPFVDPSYDRNKSKTRFLELGTTLSSRKFLIDVHFQSITGLYFNAKNNLSWGDEPYYNRPDIRTQLFGTTAQYIFNGNKFSARPIYKLDVWQKKSAGSFLGGIEAVYGSAKGDSAFIPASISNVSKGVSRVIFLLLGPSVGYGHSFVVKRHFFISAIGALNADASKVSEFSIDKKRLSDRWQFVPNFAAHAAMGYANENRELALTYVTSRFYFKGNTEIDRYAAYNDGWRLTYTQRIAAGKTIPEAVGWLRNMIEKLGFGFLIR